VFITNAEKCSGRVIVSPFPESQHWC